MAGDSGSPSVSRASQDPRFRRSRTGQGGPNGVYDLGNDEGWVSLGETAGTADFAVNSIRSWWRNMGAERFPNATRLFVTADAGGSDGYRVRAWKVELAKLAAETAWRSPSATTRRDASDTSPRQDEWLYLCRYTREKIVEVGRRPAEHERSEDVYRRGLGRLDSDHHPGRRVDAAALARSFAQRLEPALERRKFEVHYMKGDPMGKEVDKAKGKIKQAVGDLTGNKDLKKEGKADERAGKVKGFVENVKEKADELVDKVTDKATKH